MDTNRWKSVAIRRYCRYCRKDRQMTERPTSNVIAFAVKRLEEDIENGVVKDVVKT